MELYYPKIILHKGRESIAQSHPWIFSGAIQKEEIREPGGICDIYSHNGTYLGTGYWNPKSDIRVRVLSRKQEKIDTDFFRKKLEFALTQKLPYLQNTNAYRWIHAEADGLPGLIVDVYQNYAVLQIHTLGMEKRKSQILEAIQSFANIHGIYEKSNSDARTKEGLVKIHEALLWGDIPPFVEIFENQYRFLVDIPNGQKTGFFLDQRENRSKISRYIKDKVFINCFSYTGSFSVYAAQTAKKVISVDISKSALDLAKKNFAINHIDPNQHEFMEADVFDYLNGLDKNSCDAILIDPPSMAKNKVQIEGASKGYIYLNSMALKALKDYGILFSSSCTSHITDSMFLELLWKSSLQANCKLKVLDVGTQAFDHTWLLNFPEGKYLKFYIFLKVPSHES